MIAIQYVQYSCSLQQIPTSNCKRNQSFQPKQLVSQAPSSANRHTPPPPLIFCLGKHCIQYHTTMYLCRLQPLAAKHCYAHHGYPAPVMNSSCLLGFSGCFVLSVVLLPPWVLTLRHFNRTIFACVYTYVLYEMVLPSQYLFPQRGQWQTVCSVFSLTLCYI